MYAAMIRNAHSIARNQKESVVDATDRATRPGFIVSGSHQGIGET